MSPNTQNLLGIFRALIEVEREEFLSDLMSDPELREDIIDVALALEAEAEGGEAITLEEFDAGKRTY